MLPSRLGPFACTAMARIKCHASRNHYLQHFPSKFVEILSDPAYQKLQAMTDEQVAREIDSVQRLSAELRRGEGSERFDRLRP